MDSTTSPPADWKAPPELNRALPREASLTGRGLFITILAIFAIVVGIGCFYGFRQHNIESNSQNQLLQTQGRQVSAEIVRLWQTGGKSPTRMVAYAFSADHIWIHGQSQVPSSQWGGLQKAGFMPVRYLPSNPTVNHPSAWEEDTTPTWVMFGLSLIPVLMGFFIFFLLRRQAQYARDGVPAPAVVTKSFRVKNGWSVRYNFWLKDGSLYQSSDQRDRNVEPGSTLCVLYLPDKPTRCTLYPLTFYRIKT